MTTQQLSQARYHMAVMAFRARRLRSAASTWEEKIVWSKAVAFYEDAYARYVALN